MDRCVTVSLEMRNFSYLTTENSHLKFYVNCLAESYWSLNISEHDESSISVNLVCDAVKDDRPINLDFKISVLSESGSVVSKERKNNVVFVPRSKILNNVCLKHEKKAPTAHLSKLDTLILKCCLWNTCKNLIYPILYNAWSQIVVQQTSFDWKVANFKKIKCNGKKRTYDVKNGRELPNFCIELSLEGNTASQSDLCLDIRQIIKTFTFVKTSWKVSVFDLEGNTVKIIEFSPKLAPSSTYRAPTLLTKDELSSMKDQILPDNALNLRFDLTFSTGGVLSAVEGVSFLPDQVLLPKFITENGTFNASAASLQADLLFMYREQTLCDFELRSGGQTFKVHKNILSARSPVFKAMFSGDMNEASGTGLDIPDVDPDTFEFLLMFVYTGGIDTLKCESATKLYYAADKYEIMPLKKICSQILSSQVSEDSFLEILIIADMHQDKELMSSVNEFIICNDEEIIQSKKWEEFLVAYPLLAAKVMRTVWQKTRYSSAKK